MDYFLLWYNVGQRLHRAAPFFFFFFTKLRLGVDLSIDCEDPRNERGEWVMTYRANGKRNWTRMGMYHQAMLGRARAGGWVQTSHPSYAGVSVSGEFRDFQRFGDWCVEQVGWGLGHSLDKDLLLPGNRTYCAEHCILLPQPLNLAIVNNTKRTSRGLLPGAYRREGRTKWSARAPCIVSGPKHIGVFETEQEAHEAYCDHKEAYIRSLADQYRDTIDPRAYDALMNWKVGRSSH